MEIEDDIQGRPIRVNDIELEDTRMNTMGGQGPPVETERQLVLDDVGNAKK